MAEKERFEVFLEQINTKMDLLIEGHQTLDQTIDRITRELREEMAQMRGELSNEIDKISEKLLDHERRVTNLER